MDKFESLLFNLFYEIGVYKKHGITHRDFIVFEKHLQNAEKRYRQFKKKSRIIGIYGK